MDIYIFAIILQMLENSTRMSSLRPTDAVLRLLSQFGSAVSVRAREQICVVKMKTNLAAISRARSSRHSCSEKPFIVCHSRTLEFSHYPLSGARKTGFGSGGRNISGLFCRLPAGVLSWRCGDKKRQKQTSWRCTSKDTGAGMTVPVVV